MATLEEHRARLRDRFTPFVCGVGPVEAAARTAWRLRKGDVGRVVSLGSAGSARLPQGHVALIDRVSYRDMDATALGFARGETPFLDMPPVVDLPTVPGLATASLATGASVVSGDAYDAIDADMVDMETWAVMRACQLADVPMIALRAVSDGTVPLGGYRDWADHLDVVDERLAEAVDHVLAVW